MLYFNGLLGVLTLALWIFCVVDVVVTEEGSCRNLPKVLWLVLVLLLPLVGSIVWLLAGRPQAPMRAGDGPYGRSARRFPEHDRPGRFSAASAQDDEDFLRRCRERAEEQRRRARDQRDQKDR